jgi:hypothetical protein
MSTTGLAESVSASAEPPKRHEATHNMAKQRVEELFIKLAPKKTAENFAGSVWKNESREAWSARRGVVRYARPRSRWGL